MGLAHHGGLETLSHAEALQPRRSPNASSPLRDEDRFRIAASSDQIKDALLRAKPDLICSRIPRAPAGEREIELFQEWRAGRSNFGLIAASPRNLSPRAAPARYRASTGRSPQETWEEVEPIAADVRPRKTRAARAPNAALCCDWRRRYSAAASTIWRAATRSVARRGSVSNSAIAALMVVAGHRRLLWWDANLRVKYDYCAAYAKGRYPECVAE